MKNYSFYPRFFELFGLPIMDTINRRQLSSLLQNCLDPNDTRVIIISSKLSELTGFQEGYQFQWSHYYYRIKGPWKSLIDSIIKRWNTLPITPIFH